MKTSHKTLWALGLATSALAPATSLLAQTGYGVNAGGTLFRFDVTVPATVTEIGPVGFVPEGIDFRPSSSLLYAVDVGPVTTQLYTVNIATGASTPVGAGFPTVGAGYDLSGSLAPQTFGFDFNPTTLQVDNSMRIRLISSGGSNLRLHSGTGLIAVADAALSRTSVDAAAYRNNLASAGGTTTLFNLDFGTDELTIQNPPNAGTLTTVGDLGVTVDAESNTSFDILTDPSTLVDTGYAVLKRPDAPAGGPLGAYLLYSVNLGTGQITQGALVGPNASPYDFTGGFAIQPVPEAGTLAGAFCLMGAAVWQLRRRAGNRA